MLADEIMDRLSTINQADHDSAASNAAAEQPQQPQAEFEQHLLDAPGADPIYSHRELYDVTEEDDRLIQAASGAALKRDLPPRPTTVSIYDRRLRKLAEALKQDGKSISGLDDNALLGHARKLLPNDKVIAPHCQWSVGTASLTQTLSPSEHIIVLPGKMSVSSGRLPRHVLVDRSARKRPGAMRAGCGSWR
ncbi:MULTISPECIES: hypothetical protein [Bradyrhizobium]|jgi:hypothetical protein|uniref:Uncharacterized protein n=1 Tax=Bradyrhizobium elkanii TaxID=29448 RepID=A0A7Y8R7S0_BRAEL|nr:MULTISPECIES: hypothetical protein [Bradyrhizobium]MBP1290454.1 hypothetical protein [Bradyrhizobium elkanii]MBP2429010.1 hypothetical protein [Bradyrhizobium elkanii]MCA1398142.1 hypothetical protein [Bradyrhizobium sp. BRP56]MCP1728734.1 hypothetical protein [Bradyrhizobium elkanii]MCP1755579.1 hypothetical protein [Bradyrhizobium elkanii]